MRACAKCNEQIDKNAKFCPKCGEEQPVESEVSTEVETEVIDVQPIEVSEKEETIEVEENEEDNK